MLLRAYYSQNYAGIIHSSLASDHHQISKTTPPEGTVHETDATSIFIKCGMWSLFANPVTYNIIMNILYVLYSIVILFFSQQKCPSTWRSLKRSFPIRSPRRRRRVPHQPPRRPRPRPLSHPLFLGPNPATCGAILSLGGPPPMWATCTKLQLQQSRRPCVAVVGPAVTTDPM